MNGPICTLISPRKPKKKLTEIARLFEALPRLKKSMRIDTESFLQTWKEIWYSPRTAMWFGSVPTADISA